MKQTEEGPATDLAKPWIYYLEAYGNMVRRTLAQAACLSHRLSHRTCLSF